MENKKGIKKIIKPAAAIVIAAVIVVTGVSVYNKQNRRQAMAEVFAGVTSYNIETVERGELKEIITSAGTVYLENEYTIYSESTDKIKSLNFSEGDYISEGDVVAVYDTADTVKAIEKKIAEGELTLSNANLSLQSLALPVTETEKEKLEGAVTTAEKSILDKETQIESTKKDIELKLADIEKAEKTVSDNKTLLSIGAITQEDYDKSLTSLDELKISLDKLSSTLSSNQRELDSAKDNLDTAQKDLNRSAEVLTEEGEKIKYQQQLNSVANAKLSLQEAKDSYGDVVYETVSRYSGTVTSVSAEEGFSAQIGSEILTIADFDALIVRADVSEYDAPRLELGMKTEMISDGIQDAVYQGEIIKISDSASAKNSGSSTETVVSIEIAILNPDGKLKPGYNLDVDIIVVDKQDIVAISQSALQKDRKEDKQYVYTVSEEDTAVKTFVTTGLYGDMEVEILEGIKEGDRIVGNPSDELMEGMPVIVEMPAGMTGNSADRRSEMQNGADGNRSGGFSQGIQSGGNPGAGFGGGMPGGR